MDHNTIRFLTPSPLQNQHLTPQNGFAARLCYIGVVLSFLFIFAEYLKTIVNHRKIINRNVLHCKTTLGVKCVKVKGLEIRFYSSWVKLSTIDKLYFFLYHFVGTSTFSQYTVVACLVVVFLPVYSCILIMANSSYVFIHSHTAKF